jgi:hypothetical protein
MSVLPRVYVKGLVPRVALWADLGHLGPGAYWEFLWSLGDMPLKELAGPLALRQSAVPCAPTMIMSPLPKAQNNLEL